MKRFIIYMYTLLAAMSAGTTAIMGAEPLAVRSGKIVGAESGEPRPLHGVSLAWHHFADQYYNADVVRTLHRSWGADVIRAAVSVELGDGYLANPRRAMRALETVVEACIEEDCYVVIDWHCHHIRTEEAVGFFTEAARRWGDKANVIYEIYNEPENDTWSEVKAYAERVAAAIREIDPDNIIIVGSPHWDQDVDIAADDPLTGYGNIAYSFHFYADTHRAENMERCDYALSKGLPLIVSECGAMDHLGGGEVNYEWWGRWMQWAERNDIGWIAWSLSDKVETCSMLRHGAPAEGGWGIDDLKDWSLLVISSLKQKTNENR